MPFERERRSMAVVLCPPFGHEWMWSYRTYRRLAKALSTAGYPVIRFDYRGTGDSLGDETDEDQARAWVNSIHAAADEILAASGATSLALFGLRLGATLATVAAAERADVRALVLWAPYTSGRSFVREARAFARMRGEQTDTTLELAGFVLPAALQEGLRELKLPYSLTAATKLLLLQRDDMKPDLTIAAKFAEHGLTIATSETPGYSTMLRDAHDSLPPDVVINEVVDWLGHIASDTVTRPGQYSRSHALVGDAFVEQSYQFGSHATLFGIVTRPRAAARAGAPVVLLPNVGSNHHIGPCRLSVVLARRLATLGFTSLRFDIAGLGDAVPAAGMPENKLYAKESQDDAVAAMDFLGRQCGANQFVMAGLCSGAYLAYRTSLADPRIVQQILINIVTFQWNPDDTLESWYATQLKSSAYYMNNWRSGKVWRRLLKGDVNVRGITRRLLRVSGAQFAASTRQRLSRGDSPLASEFRRLAARGTKSTLLFSLSDTGIDEVERSMRMPTSKIREFPGVDLAIFPGADHTFSVPHAREALIDHLCRELDGRYPQ